MKHEVSGFAFCRDRLKECGLSHEATSAGSPCGLSHEDSSSAFRVYRNSVTVTAPLKGAVTCYAITGAITGQNGVGVFETSLFCWLKTGSVCLRRRCFAYSAPFSAHG